MYRVIVERRASKEIEALPNDVIQRVIDAIETFKSFPRPSGVKKLIGGGGWRVRVGDYRVLYTIDDSQKLVTVYRVKHRREAYR